ncbi:MAG: ABC transporter ATP-binding protein [Janthinobacterium lividum]
MIPNLPSLPNLPHSAQSVAPAPVLPTASAGPGRVLAMQDLDIELGARRLIEALDWQVERGQLWCVLGQNGVGKSTLLQVLAGLRAPASGQVSIDALPLASYRPSQLARLRGLMPQAQADAFSSRVIDTVLVGRTPHRLGGAWDSHADREAAMRALEQVDLAHNADDDVLQLSGGERQRVALATLLAQAPALLLLDEPTAHQDVARQLALMRLLRQHSQGHGVVMTCHDINLAARFATHVLVLASTCHWAGPVDEVLDKLVLEQAFGCRFSVTSVDGLPAFIAC